MPGWNVFGVGWDWNPSVIIGCAALLIAYISLNGLSLSRRTLYYFAGVFVLLFALISPLDTLGDRYLFSAHMVQHLLLILLVPPLLILGLPEKATVVLDARGMRRVEGIVGHPVIAWLIGVLTISIWHLPALYEGALENENLHIVEHLMFLISATIFWWPIVRRDRSHLSPPAAMIYLAASGQVGTLLGILVAFFPHVLYPMYLRMTDPTGMMAVVRGVWNLSPRGDQELAGLLMAIPGSMVYLGAIFIILYRWFATFDTASEMG